MKTCKQSPRQNSLTQQHRSIGTGQYVHRLLTAVVALATLLFLMIIGPVTEPDFWQLESVVRLGANLIFYTALVHTSLLPIGYIWHILLSSVEAAVSLSRQKAASLPPLRAYFSRMPTCFSPSSDILSLAAAKHQAYSLSHPWRRQHPRLRSTNKAPFGLFMQAVSLLAP
ncbi:MAG: hypothetical protein H6652_00085 [Ardenticatenaceae bacterium]|nr:hypothetical protein [Ardenticatenaceae bacterium]